MPVRLLKEFEKLKASILALGVEVERQLRLAVQSIETRDPHLARQVIDGDARIDEMEVDLEEDCLKALALYQPVAHDLRFLVSVLKMNNDLERIGDLAVNIAKRALPLAETPPMAMPFDFQTICEKTEEMLRNSLEAMVRFDTDLAYGVLEADDTVDDINRKIYRFVEEEVLKTPQNITYFIHLMGIYRQLERIADHATNIAEDVIYLAKGEIIRHREIPSPHR
ncbi:MAG: phosphate transport system regulatory protein PhoU [Myxococcales bacterium]|nr:MAG: phosphate transport system regulatory protein PhoU [Myxococcales bacterium]